MRSESPSYAAYMLEKSVSPPDEGTCTTRRMLAIGGSTSHDTSECQRLPATNSTLSSPWTTRISGCSASLGAAGWMCSAPKRLPNALCCSNVSC